jgi:hypothetical protein
MTQKYKTMRLKHDTYRKLCKYGHFGESADTVLNRILCKLETQKKQKNKKKIKKK